jgi:toxin-antitoxin system PIN domain toxin
MACLPDINVWLALTLDLHGHHTLARRWMRNLGAEVVLCRAAQQGLFRLLTTTLIMERYGVRPLTNKEAWAVFDGYLAGGRISCQDEPEGVQAVWRKLASRNTASPKLWMDAYLAAFAISGGLRLVTTDKAFRQFSGLDLLVLE